MSELSDVGATIQDRPPNFRENGRLYLVRCFACGTTDRGRENWALAVASGCCAFCGWGDSRRDVEAKRERP